MDTPPAPSLKRTETAEVRARIVYEDCAFSAPLPGDPTGSSPGCTTATGHEARADAVAALCRDVFGRHHDLIVFGPCSGGAVFELEFAERPSVQFDGADLKVDCPTLGHFHLALAPDAAPGCRGYCSRVAFFRGYLEEGADPSALGIRFWNEKGAQMLTVFFKLGDGYARESALAWHHLREQHLARQDTKHPEASTKS